MGEAGFCCCLVSVFASIVLFLSWVHPRRLQLPPFLRSENRLVSEFAPSGWALHCICCDCQPFSSDTAWTVSQWVPMRTVTEKYLASSTSQLSPTRNLQFLQRILSVRGRTLIFTSASNPEGKQDMRESPQPVCCNLPCHTWVFMVSERCIWVGKNV